LPGRLRARRPPAGDSLERRHDPAVGRVLKDEDQRSSQNVCSVRPTVPFPIVDTIWTSRGIS
jgi:hypothetical protein